MQHFHRPPNRHTMSDDVIGSVVQRRQPVRQSFFVETTIGIHAALELQNCSGDSGWSPPRCAPQRSDKCSTTPRPLTMQEIHTIADKDTLSELRSILKTHRERRKIIQQRHLKKKQKMVENLTDAIPKFRNEIEKLQLHRLNLRERLPKENAWFVAIEYFRIFQYGIPEPEGCQTRVSNFLKATMASDLDMEKTSGIEAFTQSWRLFTLAFPDGRIQLESLKQLTADFVIATTNTSVTLTEHTLQCLFHSLKDTSKANIKRREHIFARLLDQRVVMSGSVRFDWDGETKRVVGVYSDTDMLTPILDLLGSLEDVSFVFSGALVTPDGNFVLEKAIQL